MSASSLPKPTVAGTIAFASVVGEADPDMPENADICVVNADGTGLQQLTDGPEWEEHPSWSPDGSHIVYNVGSNSYPRDNPSIWVMKADGSGKVRLTAGYEPHWSPDGKHIVFTRYFPGTGRYDDLFVMNADGSGLKLVTDRPLGEARPSWLSDGRIVFTNGADRACVVNLDGSGRGQLAKGKGVGDIAGSPDGKLLAYASATAESVVVSRLSGRGTPVTLLKPIRDYFPDDSFSGEPAGVAVAWTPNGKALAVSGTTANHTAGEPIFVVMASGTRLSAVPGIDHAIDATWRPE